MAMLINCSMAREEHRECHEIPFNSQSNKSIDLNKEKSSHRMEVKEIHLMIVVMLLFEIETKKSIHCQWKQFHCYSLFISHSSFDRKIGQIWCISHFSFCYDRFLINGHIQWINSDHIADKRQDNGFGEICFIGIHWTLPRRVFCSFPTSKFSPSICKVCPHPSKNIFGST